MFDDQFTVDFNLKRKQQSFWDKRFRWALENLPGSIRLVQCRLELSTSLFRVSSREPERPDFWPTTFRSASTSCDRKERQRDRLGFGSTICQFRRDSAKESETAKRCFCCWRWFAALETVGDSEFGFAATPGCRSHCRRCSFAHLRCTKDRSEKKIKISILFWEYIRWKDRLLYLIWFHLRKRQYNSNLN
jgi:hypothetical protein